MYGFVAIFALFLLAMVIITVGEMLVSPVSQAIVSRLAPEDKRGRYMAVYGFSWLIPIAIGPLLAGIVMDNYNPDLVWYLAGAAGVASAAAFYGLQWWTGRVRFKGIAKRLAIMERLEEGEINAEEASQMLAGVSDGAWSSLTAPEDTARIRELRIRVSDAATGTMKSDLRIPAGLINAVVPGEGRISVDLERYDQVELKNMIARSSNGSSTEQMDAGDDQIEISIE
jgi:MFS family permease